MEEKKNTIARIAGLHIKERLISGLFVLVPLGITVIILRALFLSMAAFVRPFVQMLPGALSEGAITAISGLIFVILVYMVGLITAKLLGKRIIAAVESVILQIPLVRTIYSTSKQVLDTISPSGRESFKSVVLVDFPRIGLKSIGFVTGSMRDGRGNEMRKVFVPTAPNPTSGFLLLVSPEELQETSLSVEDAFKMIMSGGVISPGKL